MTNIVRVCHSGRDIRKLPENSLVVESRLTWRTFQTQAQY